MRVLETTATIMMSVVAVNGVYSRPELLVRVVGMRSPTATASRLCKGTSIHSERVIRID
jgi:hypothetical protein